MNGRHVTTVPILTLNIRYEHDAVAARQRARQIARVAGFDAQDQTRIATAVSEIARNAFRYAGGGKVEYAMEGDPMPEALSIRIVDTGAGIGDLDRILEGRYRSSTGMGMGILGARRLMDEFEIRSDPGHGTTVLLRKRLPQRTSASTRDVIARITEAVAAGKPEDPFAEIQLQNQELLRTLDELRKRQEELTHLNRELQDTNRGVVALYAELDEKADHLRRADDLKSKFLSNMSHEFRSPLNSIVALTRLLADEVDGPLNAEQHQQVGYVRRAAEDLYELVNDLLDLAKVEAGKVEVKPVEFEVADLFGALRGMLRPLFLNQSVNLVFESTVGLPPLYSDEGKISQILRNFISNALKFTERGEVRVSAAVVDGDHVKFSVADTGIGIAPEDQERIFQDFAQVENPIQKRVKGTGLGLPLSRKLAHLLGGEVQLTSGLGAGSTFSVVLPAAYRKDPETGEAAQMNLQPGMRPVLVVENSDEAVLLYGKWLKDSDFQIVRAATVAEAHRKLAVFKPAVIVLDIMLRGEDSWSFLAKLKESPATKEVPVLVVTTLDDPRKAYQLGAGGYMSKPVDPQWFRSELTRLAPKTPLDRVLIIDDNERDRYLLKHLLRAMNVSVTEASNGEDGLAKARAECPRLIFLDLAMLEMSGFEVFRLLQSDPRTSGIKIIINTSMRLDAAGRERLHGAAAVMSKERLEREDALATVREVLDSIAAAGTIADAGRDAHNYQR
ncbi:MAG TPA: ATP-binding protein [Bryobacteraceae bacterium]|jgi:signal transduction histidine kinase/CheY-like chemotaxis protein|nr:ATP-binding protein [Bryobacteraceae bacterium]